MDRRTNGRQIDKSIDYINLKQAIIQTDRHTLSTVASSVNGRQFFFVINSSEQDWNSEDLIYVLTLKVEN